MKIIPLTKGQSALVDDDDFERLSKFNWCSKLSHKGKVRDIWYARRGVRAGGPQVGFKMHREILGIRDPKIKVDHIDGNGLNNQKSNLRICTESQNRMNTVKRANCTSKFKGVFWHKNRKEWVSRVNMNKKNIFCAYYKNEKEAALAYNVVASFAFREFANLNRI